MSDVNSHHTKVKADIGLTKVMQVKDMCHVFLYRNINIMTWL